MKSLAVFIQEINGGSTHAACTADLAELDRPERAIEDAFTGYVEQVQERSGYSVLIGIPEKA